MSIKGDDPIRPGSSHMHVNEIVAGLPSRLRPVRIYRSRAETNIGCLPRNSLAMLVTEHLYCRTIANRFVCRIPVHQPVWRVMAEYKVYDIVDRVEHCLQGTEIEATPQVVFAILARQQRGGKPVHT